MTAAVGWNWGEEVHEGNVAPTQVVPAGMGVGYFENRVSQLEWFSRPEGCFLYNLQPFFIVNIIAAKRKIVNTKATVN